MQTFTPVVDRCQHPIFRADATNAQAGDPTRSEQIELRRLAVEAARQAVIAMRASDEIGDDAFHQIEEELDWLEMTAPRTAGMKP